MNKYSQLINVEHLEAWKEFTTLRKLLASVGITESYRNQLEQIKMDWALQHALATKGLGYIKPDSNKFKIVIVAL